MLMKKWLIVALCAVVLAACGGQESAAPVEPAKSQTFVPSSLKVAGFYVGMDVNDVPSTMLEMLSERGLSNFGFTDVIRYSSGEHCVLLYDKGFLSAIESRMQERYDVVRAKGKIEDELEASCYASDGVLVVKAGTTGRVNSIEFNNVGKLLEDGKLAPEEFARKLASEQQIPGLTPNDERTGWSYTSPDGARLEIRVRQVFGIPVTRLVMTRSDI
jgi:hypothetical protein